MSDSRPEPSDSQYQEEPIVHDRLARSRRPWVLGGLIGAALAGGVVAVVLALSGGDSVDADVDGFREAYRARHGTTRGFDRIVEIYRDVCVDDERTFSFFVAIGLDEGTHDAAEIEEDISYMCPDRLDEVREVTRR